MYHSHHDSSGNKDSPYWMLKSHLWTLDMERFLAAGNNLLPDAVFVVVYGSQAMSQCFLCAAWVLQNPLRQNSRRTDANSLNRCVNS